MKNLTKIIINVLIGTFNLLLSLSSIVILPICHLISIILMPIYGKTLKDGAWSRIYVGVLKLTYKHLKLYIEMFKKQGWLINVDHHNTEIIGITIKSKELVYNETL